MSSEMTDSPAHDVPPDVPMEDRHPMTGNRMSSDEDTGRGIEKHVYDVVVIGAGVPGPRAPGAAHAAESKGASAWKSLRRKTHTVRGEGAPGATLGNLRP